jgi:hypothetical protein
MPNSAYQQGNNGHRLSGAKPICRYCGRQWQTVSEWIRDEGFPAAKISGRWETFSHLVDNWFLDKIIGKGKDET